LYDKQALPGLQAVARRYKFWPRMAVQQISDNMSAQLKQARVKLQELEELNQNFNQADVADTTQIRNCELQLNAWRSKRDELEESLKLMNDALQEVVRNIEVVFASS
jgi:hypothetical protein